MTSKLQSESDEAGVGRSKYLISSRNRYLEKEEVKTVEAIPNSKKMQLFEQLNREQESVNISGTLQ